MSIFLPPEIIPHKIRLSKETLHWLEDKLEKNNDKNLDKFAELMFDLIDQHEIVDAEIAYIAVKAGVMTSKLAKVINIGKANHPAIKAYQALAHLYMNNFSQANDLLEQAETEAEKMDDVLVLAEIYGIKIYLYNARYQFFQGVKIIQKAFDILDKPKNKALVEANPSFVQWIRISGAKSLLKLGNVPEAFYTNKRALKLSNDRFFKALSMLGIGHCYDLIGKTGDSIQYYKRALKQANEIKSYNIISIIYNRLGMALAWRMDKLADGENYFSEAIVSAERGECFWLKEGPQWNLIALYRAKKDYNSAILEIEEIIESTRRVGESRTELIALLNLGELLEEKGDVKEAEKVREAADSLATLIGIDVEEFYESDEEEQEETDEEDESARDNDSEDTNYDNSENDMNYDYYEKDYDTDEDIYIDEESSSKIKFDETLGEEDGANSPENEYEDSDDILRRFFEKKDK